METLVDACPKARGMIEGAAFSICFRTLSGLRTCLSFNEGLCQFFGPRKTRAEIELLFLAERQAVRMFEKKLAIAPTPIRGITRLSSVKPFKQLADYMECFLKPKAGDLKDAAFRATAVEMLLTVALAGVCQLAEYEAFARESVAQGPQGLIVFHLPGEMRAFWLRLESGNLEWGRGEPSTSPSVSIRFMDTNIALGALLNKIASQAEVGLGNIQVDGLVPLADHLSMLLERIHLYLE